MLPIAFLHLSDAGTEFPSSTLVAFYISGTRKKNLESEVLCFGNWKVNWHHSIRFTECPFTLCPSIPFGLLQLRTIKTSYGDWILLAGRHGPYTECTMLCVFGGKILEVKQSSFPTFKLIKRSSVQTSSQQTTTKSCGKFPTSLRFKCCQQVLVVQSSSKTWQDISTKSRE